MKLQDQLYDAVADVSTDLPALAAASRRQGLGIRRRRRALASVGVAAAVVVVAVAAVALRPGASSPADTAMDFAATNLSGRTAPNTGRATATSLAAAVQQVADGTLSDFVGQGPESPGASPGSTFSYGYVFLTPASGGPGGGITINLQRLSDPQRCPGGKGPSACSSAGSDACTDPQHIDCSSTALPNGDTLRTFTILGGQGSDAVYRMATLVSPARHLRIAAVATNMDWDERVTRPDAVLSLEQLREVVTQPWWDLELPEEYADAGRRLESYRDVFAARPGVAPSASPHGG